MAQDLYYQNKDKTVEQLERQSNRCDSDVEKHRRAVKFAADDVPRLLLTQFVNKKLIAEKEKKRSAKDKARQLKADEARQIEQIKERTKRAQQELLTGGGGGGRATSSIDLYEDDYHSDESGKENEYQANADGYDDGSGFIVNEDDACSYFNDTMTVNGR